MSELRGNLQIIKWRVYDALNLDALDLADTWRAKLGWLIAGVACLGLISFLGMWPLVRWTVGALGWFFGTSLGLAFLCFWAIVGGISLVASHNAKNLAPPPSPPVPLHPYGPQHAIADFSERQPYGTASLASASDLQRALDGPNAFGPAPTFEE